MCEPCYTIDMLTGHIELETWFDWRGEVGIGMSRGRHYDSHGRLVQEVVMESGIEVYPYPRTPEKSWWKKALDTAAELMGYSAPAAELEHQSRTSMMEAAAPVAQK